ncbi:Hypp9329 [Branchiostoma lanceolatum]|uniref:Hypp9329 protein n=1 Tax=Branchiostoma lanceolatum TaxID=7740 RepID=A0A8S4MLN5_BRALA|nr:Hypp9329 [Branchiostoma lanceolatum]
MPYMPQNSSYMRNVVDSIVFDGKMAASHSSPSNYVSIKVVRKGGNVVTDWYAIDVGEGELTFIQLYERLVAASEFRPQNFRHVLSRTAAVNFYVNEEKCGRGVEVYSGLQVGQATRQFGCFVRMEVDKTAAESTDDPRPKSAFEVMMSASRDQSQHQMMWPSYAGTSGGVNNNVRGHTMLYNSIVDLLKAQGFRFIRTKGNEASSKEIVYAIRNAVWYILPHLKTLADRSIHLPEALGSLYNRNDYSQVYNNPVLHRHNLGQLSSKDLDMHAQELYKVACLPLLQQEKFKHVKDIVVNLGKNLSKYNEHLQASNQKVQEQRKQMFPVRTVEDGCSSALRVIEAKARSDAKLITRYANIESYLDSVEEYQLCFLNDFAPSDYRKRYEYMNELQLPMSVEVYTYKSGNSLGALHFVWKIPATKETRDLNQTSKLMHLAEKEVPVYHTREMRRRFRDRFSLVTKATASNFYG